MYANVHILSLSLILAQAVYAISQRTEFTLSFQVSVH